MSHVETHTKTLFTTRKKVPGVKRVPEDYPWRRDALQFLTLTFDERHHKKRLDTLWFHTLPDAIRNLRRISKNYFHIFSELTEKGILHYHIICKHHNYLAMKAFRGWWFRKYGYTDLQKVKKSPKDFLNLFTYCRKDTFEMMNHILPTERLKTSYARIFCSIPSHHNIRNVYQFIYNCLEERRNKQIVTNKQQEYNRFLQKLISFPTP